VCLLGLRGGCKESPEMLQCLGMQALKLHNRVFADGNVTAAASRGLVRPDSEPLGGLAHPVVLASVTVALAAVAVAWIAWSRSGRA
jgi:hypothetical protein